GEVLVERAHPDAGPLAHALDRDILDGLTSPEQLVGGRHDRLDQRARSRLLRLPSKVAPEHAVDRVTQTLPRTLGGRHTFTGAYQWRRSVPIRTRPCRTSAPLRGGLARAALASFHGTFAPYAGRAFTRRPLSSTLHGCCSLVPRRPRSTLSPWLSRPTTMGSM